jgi:signal peptidase I
MEVDGEMVKAQKKIALAGLAENPVVLGADEYFLLGDNRDSSEDSRFANVGNVKESQIIGKVWFRIHPTLNMGIIR